MCATCQKTNATLNHFLKRLTSEVEIIMKGNGKALNLAGEMGVHHFTSQYRKASDVQLKHDIGKSTYEEVLRSGFNLGLRAVLERMYNDYRRVSHGFDDEINLWDACTTPPVAPEDIKIPSLPEFY
jgi:hypothetical protein